MQKSIRLIVLCNKKCEGVEEHAKEKENPKGRKLEERKHVENAKENVEDHVEDKLIFS